MSDSLKRSITTLKGIGSARARLFSQLGIFSLEDLLTYYPKRYEDWGEKCVIGQLKSEEMQYCIAKVQGGKNTRTRRGLILTKLLVKDETGSAELIWFGQPNRVNMYKNGEVLHIYGKVYRKYQRIEIDNPEVEIGDSSGLSENRGGENRRIFPIYSSTENLSQRLFRQVMKQAIEEGKPSVSDCLEKSIVGEVNLLSKQEAMEKVHFPTSLDEAEEARRRLVFEELYLFQSALMIMRQRQQNGEEGVAHQIDGANMHRFFKQLPFSLTADQRSAWQEIKRDMEASVPMQRLLQGDVGSGKTIVAALALVKTTESNYQGAFMAPTEILAEQHYATLHSFMEPLGISMELLTGSFSAKIRQEKLKKIKNGQVQLVIGTHALIQDGVEFSRLGLVITDEQHRFGVQQRICLKNKCNTQPDVLVMSATPIPRTMALTIYGDMDVSVIRELPPGRKIVKTYARGHDRRDRVYTFVANEVVKGRQAYIVCPLIEESDKVEHQSVINVFEELSNTIFTGISCGILYGRMHQDEKNKIMQSFYAGEISILFATTVIEVGVNVPNATVMVVEDANKFGLAQLHQLRGRIGRGEFQSYCVLLYKGDSGNIPERMKAMTEIQDGFLLAEKDLLLRGAGQINGFRQHGLSDFKIADIVKDRDILLDARNMVKKYCQTVGWKERLLPIIKRNYPQLLERELGSG